MRVAVLGSTGMAGHMVSLYLQEKGYDIFRVSRSEKDTKRSRSIDVTHFTALTSYFNEIGCDVIINCVGLLQKGCDSHPDKAILINSYLPHFLEAIYKNTSTKIIHLSTDCVFSGTRGGYKDDDLPDGLSMYDRSKALGELNNDKDLTFRMSIIGPDIDSHGTGLLNWFMKQEGIVDGYKNAIWNGITTLELAEAIDMAIQCSLSGLYQLVPDENISKYHLLLLFQQILAKDNVEIEANEQVYLDKTLVNCRKDFNYTVKNYPQQIQQLRTWIDEHSSIYPEYYTK